MRSMGDRDLALILHRIRQTAAEVGGISDSQLLQRFIVDRDEAAFELLLWRHARLVFGVCQRVLGDTHDAEDAFQATILILARRASRIKKRDALASWLYKVAYRTALTLRGQRTRKATREWSLSAAAEVAVPPQAATAPEQEELKRLLDHEVNRLPERLRALVVLCYLEGKTVDEAAVQIGCPRGTAASRLARARQRLRRRLAGRGLSLAAGLTVLQQAEAAPRPFHLLSSLFPAVVRSPSGVALAAGFPRSVLSLTHEVLRAMFWQKLKAASAILIAFAFLLLAGGGLVVHLPAGAAPGAGQLAAGDDARSPRDPQAAPEQQAADAAAKIKSVKVSQPLRRNFTPYQDYTGRLQALRTVQVSASVNGKIEKICFKPGAEVKKGEVLFQLDSTAYRIALDKAEADLASAAAQKKLSETRLKRARQMKESKALGQEEYDQTVAEAAAAEAKWKAAKADHDRAKLKLAATRITAPADGLIGEAEVGVGNYVTAEGGAVLVLATITSVDPIGLSFDMDESSFLRYRRLLRAGEVKGTGSPIAMALVDEESFARTGTLEGFDVRIDPKTGTIRVSGTFPNHDRLLLPGLWARVRMPFGKPRPVLEIPAQALGNDQGKSWVYVVNKLNTIEKRFLKDIFGYDGISLVEEGLDADDLVVVEKLTDIHTGDKVKPERTREPTPAANK
jgi:membrane fusion protein, multidrug efflux system